MTYVETPLVRDPSFTMSSALHWGKFDTEAKGLSDTDSSEASAQTPQEAIKGIGHWRHRQGGKTGHRNMWTDKVRPFTWMDANTCLVRRRGSDCATRKQQEAPASLLASVPSLLYVLFWLNLSASPGGLFHLCLRVFYQGRSGEATDVVREFQDHWD